MSASNSYFQRRPEELSELGLIRAKVKLAAGGKPIKSYKITGGGNKVIETLENLLSRKTLIKRFRILFMRLLAWR